MQQESQDRMALKDLVDRYATESDKNNQDYYREIFTSDIKLKVYFGDKLGMDIHNVEDMIALAAPNALRLHFTKMDNKS